MLRPWSRAPMWFWSTLSSILSGWIRVASRLPLLGGNRMYVLLLWATAFVHSAQLVMAILSTLITQCGDCGLAHLPLSGYGARLLWLLYLTGGPTTADSMYVQLHRTGGPSRRIGFGGHILPAGPVHTPGQSSRAAFGCSTIPGATRVLVVIH